MATRQWPVQHLTLSFPRVSKCPPPSLPCFYSHCLWSSPLEHTLPSTRPLVTSSRAVKCHGRLRRKEQVKTVNLRTRRRTGSGSSSLRSKGESLVEKSVVSVGEEENEQGFGDGEGETDGELGVGGEEETMASFGSVLQLGEILNSLIGDGQVGSGRKEGDSGDAEVRKVGDGEGYKKKMAASLSKVELRAGLKMCSRKGDVMGAIELYDFAQRERIHLRPYQYLMLWDLFLSAAFGVVQPAKIGRGARALNELDVAGERAGLDTSGLSESSGKVSNNEQRSVNAGKDSGGGETDMEPGRRKVNGRENNVDVDVWVSEDVKKHALQRVYDIYEKMLSGKVRMNEVVLRSVARIAMSMGNGDVAFDIVKQMKGLGVDLKTRSYNPALTAYCNSGNIDKAFTVEKHMLENGVPLEEPELEALLRVSIEAAEADRVYYLLHKLRACTTTVSPSTAKVLVRWFRSRKASRVGKKKWIKKFIREAIENRGGGWHGQGWLGCGKWKISYTSVGEDALCRCCGKKLTITDLDPIRTENLAEEVASFATTSESQRRFEKFQKWLEEFGPFDVVVDGANVGCLDSWNFLTSKIDAVVNAIREKLPSQGWPLVVLHYRRITRKNKIFAHWKEVHALYATPDGSNDDWYWLYAAIKCKALIVTNDGMGDHKYKLLGKNFFRKWKESYQVRVGVSDDLPVLSFPLPYSVGIQESEEGDWHIPIAKDDGPEANRTWLCITRKSPRR